MANEFYKQEWFWVIIAIIVLGSISILNLDQEKKSNSEFPEELQYVETPKTICLTNEQIYFTEQMYDNQVEISKLDAQLGGYYAEDIQNKEHIKSVYNLELAKWCKDNEYLKIFE